MPYTVSEVMFPGFGEHEVEPAYVMARRAQLQLPNGDMHLDLNAYPACPSCLISWTGVPFWASRLNILRYTFLSQLGGLRQAPWPTFVLDGPAISWRCHVSSVLTRT